MVRGAAAEIGLAPFVIMPPPDGRGGDGADRGSASSDAAAGSGYRRRKPERTLLRTTVRAHLKTFVAEMDGEGGADLFINECTLADVPPFADVRHLTVQDIARLRPGWNARRVVLTHLSAESRRVAASLKGVEVAEDGRSIEL